MQDATRYNTLSRSDARFILRTLILGLLALAAALALVLFPGSAEATGFLPIVEDLPDRDVIVVTAEGREVAGRITGYTEGFRGLSRITVESWEGERLKLRVPDIDRLTVPVYGPALAEHATTTIHEAARTDWEQLLEARELVWDSLTAPGKKKPRLYQRLNTGFDTRIRVYGLPSQQTTVHTINGVAAFGGLPKAYLVVREGSAPRWVNKANFGQTFDELFGDCPEVAERFGPDQRGFRQFADHVYFFETTCR